MIFDRKESNSLMHLENTLRKRKYDPVKRKEYYERTKKLKGRKKGNKTWAKDLQYNTKKGLEAMEKRRKNPLQLKIEGASKIELEDAMDSLARVRKHLKLSGLEGLEQDKRLEALQVKVANEYFKSSSGSYGSGRMVRDRHGNLVSLPSNISTNMFVDLNWNARNDWAPDLQNPVKNLKKLDFQSPFKKSKENTVKVGGDKTKILPDDKPAEKAPKGWKAPKPSIESWVAKELNKDRKMPWEKDKGQIEDRRKKKKS